MRMRREPRGTEKRVKEREGGIPPSLIFAFPVDIIIGVPMFTTCSWTGPLGCFAPMKKDHDFICL